MNAYGECQCQEAHHQHYSEWLDNIFTRHYKNSSSYRAGERTWECWLMKATNNQPYTITGRKSPSTNTLRYRGHRRWIASVPAKFKAHQKCATHLRATVRLSLIVLYRSQSSSLSICRDLLLNLAVDILGLSSKKLNDVINRIMKGEERVRCG